MFTLFTFGGGPPTWLLNTKLYNFTRSISTNISTLEQRTHLKLRELTSLFIVYKYNNFLTLSTAWFLILFSLRDNACTLYLMHYKPLFSCFTLLGLLCQFLCTGTGQCTTKTADCGLRTADCRLRTGTGTANCGLHATDC